ncbi:MAG: hypothetical protein ACLS67_24185 [Anaerobutyricum soehngenii]
MKQNEAFLPLIFTDLFLCAICHRDNRKAGYTIRNETGGYRLLFSGTGHGSAA